MSAIQPRALPELSEYEQNRQLFTDEQLAPYDQQWVAITSDGKRIVAGGADLLELDRRIREAGEDPENVGLEFIDLSPEIWVGGVEFDG
jgi:hypothetical protein